MENNFTIDYAKTLYKPVRPSSIHNMVRSYDIHKTPYFFQYAKKKTVSQVEIINNSCVNRLKTIIPETEV